jgi:hypothetical protein
MLLFWVIVAAVIWLIVPFFVRLGGLKKLWSVAVWSFLLAFFLNQTFIAKGLYLFHQAYFPYQGIPLAYFLGAAGAGIILIRFLPEERWWQLIYLVLFTAVISGIEFFAVENGYLEYIQWSIHESFIFRLIAYIALTWISSLTVKRKKTYRYH